MIGEKRSELEILRDVLDLARRGERKTRIMYRANLSYEMLNRYLGFLTDRRFLVACSDGSFTVTEAGHRLLADLERVVRHFEPATESTTVQPSTPIVPSPPPAPDRPEAGRLHP